MKTEILKTAAGHTITAQVFPAIDPISSKGVCIIATATGVAQRLYEDFAHWLAQHNYTAVTFDYDGIGLSIDRHVKFSKSDNLPTLIEFGGDRYFNLVHQFIGCDFR